MNSIILNELKNKIYETEGLLELLQLREDKVHEILPLVNRRFDEAANLLRSLSAIEKEDEMPEKDELEDREQKEEDTECIEKDEPESNCGDSESGSVERQPSEPEDSLYEVDEDTVVMQSEVMQSVSAPAFCLNDRFRFRRTLFGGSNKEFNAVMDHIATLTSFEEAEDYFYGDRGFEPEDEDVVDFMEIIRNYFSR